MAFGSWAKKINKNNGDKIKAWIENEQKPRLKPVTLLGNNKR